jgi:hypothetical protein
MFGKSERRGYTYIGIRPLKFDTNRHSYSLSTERADHAHRPDLVHRVPRGPGPPGAVERPSRFPQ